MNEEAFTKSSLRILFVLKEANDPGGGGWDLRDVLRDGERWQTWNTVTRWLKAIRKLPAHTPWSDLNDVNRDNRLEELQSIAAINVKKSPGRHTAENAEVKDAGDRDQDYLRKQIEIYDAELIICCGSVVSDAVEAALYSDDAKPDWKETSRGIWYYEHSSGQHVISYSHPAARVAGPLLHYGLIDAIRSIRYGDE